jgi:hypothetical protein
MIAPWRGTQHLIPQRHAGRRRMPQCHAGRHRSSRLGRRTWPHRRGRRDRHGERRRRRGREGPGEVRGCHGRWRTAAWATSRWRLSTGCRGWAWGEHHQRGGIPCSCPCSCRSHRGVGWGRERAPLLPTARSRRAATNGRGWSGGLGDEGGGGGVGGAVRHLHLL